MKEKITVLIADDNKDFSQTLAGYLEKQEDMEVIGMAKDGAEAVEMIANTIPDIALIDIIMPHLDGIGVLEKIGKLNLPKRPTCIMLSAVGQDKITQRAILLGAEYYVVKPFDIEVLIKRIRQIKNYVPTNNSNSFIARKQTIHRNTRRKKERKEKFRSTSNKHYTRSRSTSTHKRISIFKRSHNNGSKRHRCNKSNNKKFISRNSK